MLALAMNSAGLSAMNWQGANFVLAQGVKPSVVQVRDSSGKGFQAAALTTVVDTVAQSVTQTYIWGSMVTTYSVAGNALNVSVAIYNSTPNPLVKYWLLPLGIQLPATPALPPGMAFNVDAPSSVWWDYGTGTIALVNLDPYSPLALGFWAATSPATTQWLISLNVDPAHSLNPNWPSVNNPIAPGATGTFKISLRFGTPGQPESQLSGDVFARYANAHARIFTQPAIRKPIGRMSYTKAIHPSLPTNPRGWWGDPTVDVTTPQGIAAFQKNLLNGADIAVAELARVGAQACIFWDLDGQQLTQSYIGDPAQMETVAPELLGVLDSFIGKFTSAGLRVGFTLRPQAFSQVTGTVDVNGAAVTLRSGSQFDPAWVGQQGGGMIAIGTGMYSIASVQSPTSLTLNGNAGLQAAAPYTYGLQSGSADPYVTLRSKIQYAMRRWGATLFYVDSNLAFGTSDITPASVFYRLMVDFPSILIIPEWKSVQHFAYTYPWLDSTLGVFAPGPQMLSTYPAAAGVVRVQGDGSIASTLPQLVASIQAGNILLFDGWYPHSGNDIVMQAYQQA